MKNITKTLTFITSIMIMPMLLTCYVTDSLIPLIWYALYIPVMVLVALVPFDGENGIVDFLK